jgi:serine/threonine-protein phosphatase PGAM5
MGPSSLRRHAWLWTLALIVSLAAPVAAQAPPPGPGPPPAPRGLRTLILVRHGVYDETDGRDPEIGRALLPEGREQARITGERLAAWPQRVDAVYASTMTRARETAEIIMKSLPGVPLTADRDLRECEPPGNRDASRHGPTPEEADSCAARIDGRLARYFRPSPERDSTEVLVCHGNVIRWLVCRAMGADPKLWLSMSPANCSLTVIQVRANGTYKITAMGDRGHLPVALQTWAMPRPAPADSVRR